MKKTISIIICCFTLCSCISLNSMQSGRTLGKDNNSFSFDASGGDLDSALYWNREKCYMSSVTLNRGITDKLDLGLSLNFVGHLTLKSKFQYLGNRESLFASSLGFDAMYNIIGLLSGYPDAGYGVSISSYNSLHLFEYFSITLSPRYILYSSHEFPSNDRNNDIYGYTAGIMIGEKNKIVFEISQYVNNKPYTFKTSPQFGVGYIYQF